MRVLVATDGSESAAKALDLAASIQWPAASELRVVTVIEPVEAVLYEAWLDLDSDGTYANASAAAARGFVEHGQRVLARTGAHISPCTRHGRAANEIVADAEEFRADLIIMGNSGHGAIASALLGSVSAEVTDRAPCPVLVARESTLTRAILAVDGSEFGRAAEDVVAQWPIFERVAIEATNVTDSMPVATALALRSMPPRPDDVAETAAAGHRRVVDEAVERLRSANRSVRGGLARGAPAYELMRLADEHAADVIVLGTHGRTGLQRALLGSVARNVLLHAKCSVLIVRSLNGEVLGAAA